MVRFGRRVSIALAGVFLALSATLLMAFKLTEPRILVLHSYDVDYSWTRDINTGLQRILDPLLRCRVHWHYLDAKNHPGRDFKRRAASTALRVIRNVNPDLIIAIDDDAQDVVRLLLDERRIPIVHAGINGSIEAYGYDK